MVGGYQIIDLDKYIDKKITQDQLFDIIGYNIERKKPVMYKITSAQKNIYRTYDAFVDINGSNYRLYLQVVYDTSGQLNQFVSTSSVFVDFTSQSDGNYLVSVGEV